MCLEWPKKVCRTFCTFRISPHFMVSFTMMSGKEINDEFKSGFKLIWNMKCRDLILVSSFSPWDVSKKVPKIVIYDIF